LNETSRSTEPLSVTQHLRHANIADGQKEKAVDLVHGAVVYMTESQKALHESRECYGLAQGGCRG
jgi:hypothetical protein